MALGTYVEILHYVNDLSGAGDYYQRLGLVALGDDVYTDGRYHLRLLAGPAAPTSLRYYGCASDGAMTSPAGITIQMSSEPPPRSLPHTNIASAPDITRLGKFGELSAMIADLEVECAFWEAAGYTTLGKYTAPQPWGIWCDKLFLIGLHQAESADGFAICHFAPDMKTVNAQLLAEGFDLQPFESGLPPDDLSYRKLLTPYGQLFYLFTGDISEAKP